MKKPIFFMGLLLLFGISTILLGQLYEVKSDSDTSKIETQQVKVIQDFWNDSLEGKDVEKYITHTPKEYLNEKSRCSSNYENTFYEKKDGLPSMSVFPEDKFDEDLKKTARKIGEGQYKVLDIKNYRSWKNEAIVEVTYRRTEELDYREKWYFFMIKTDDSWKTFLDTPVLTFFNKEYARLECN